MACVIILRQTDATQSQQYWLQGTGWGALSDASTYSSKEAALPNAETLRESLGPTALLCVKDTTTGEEHPIPHFNP